MQKEKISRHQFLRNLGLGGAALVAVYCSGAALTSCTNEGTIAPAPSGGLDAHTASQYGLDNRYGSFHGYGRQAYY
ncbi:MAG: hypothetical protein NWP83_00555 [Spirosomaceae bacterium]|nr:hypothetical protein [Spirosomataceae bacterium]